MFTNQFANRTALKFLILSIGFLMHSVALPQASDEPLTINADSAEVNQMDNTTIYSGNVILTQGDLQLNADTLIISVADSNVDSVNAQGTPVVVTRTDASNCDVEGRGERLEYNPKTETIILIGRAKLSQQNTTLEGERIVYNLNDATLKSEGRTRTVFPLTGGKPVTCRPQRSV